MQNYGWILLLAGILAGLVNFFANYIILPFGKGTNTLEEDPSKLKDIWWFAVIGYAVVGCAGSFLTPLLNAIIGTGLKGLEWVSENGKLQPKDPNYGYILFGYGLVFGYSTTRLLISILDALMKKMSALELKFRNLQSSARLNKITDFALSSAADVIDKCEKDFEANNTDCSAFVKAVGQDLGITLTGQADDIVDQIRGTGWTVLTGGPEAKQKADAGWFLVAGMKGVDLDPPNAHGHVVVVVSGPIAQLKYPSAYWGKLGGVGSKNTTLNYAFNPTSRDRVLYSARQI